MSEILIDFRHGLGDAVQLTAILQHLRHYHPEWDVDVAALVGKHSALYGLCRNVIVRRRDSANGRHYQRRFSLDWDECRASYPHWPSTKVASCLLNVFHLNPLEELCTYKIHRSQQADQLAQDYLRDICGAGPDKSGRYRTVLIHYEGNTSGDQKNLSHELAGQVCEVVLAHGATPVILDWDRRSPLPDGVRIFNPDADHLLWGRQGTGDAEVLAALMEFSRLVVGVDSGPLHVAGATTTATVGVWTHHHPVHYFDLADNVLHLVPGNHESLAAGSEARRYFEHHYRYRSYRQLHIELPATVESLLSGEDAERIANRRFLGSLTSQSFNRQYYEEHKLAGLDYLGFGDWQQQYGRWIVESLRLEGRQLLDVGCACGSILRGFYEAGALVQGVDLNEHTIQLGREKWPDMADRLFVCDAVNLHLFADDSLDAIHSAQAAEHWKADLVPHILRELRRVVVPQGLLFCALDTEELFVRQERQRDKEDPTHVCIRPLSWWHAKLRETGWEVCTGEFDSVLRDHPQSFLSRYDWEWFVARKANSHETMAGGG